MLTPLKRLFRRRMPLAVLDLYRRARYGRTWFDYEDRSPKEVFTHIYKGGVWGRGNGMFYSGPGSDDGVTAPYVAAVRDFISTHRLKSLVDLGCGDFRVGQQLVEPGITYVGIDIVEDVIDQNRRLHASPNVAFVCLDAIQSPLPEGELCLVREVLQHLTNVEIETILQRCEKFRYTVVTEKIAAAERFDVANVDIAHGPHVRSDSGSGVVLEAPPFSRRVTLLLENRQDDGTILRSVVLAGGPGTLPGESR